jgi:uncharacterized membrane protein (GlpM family)
MFFLFKIVFSVSVIVILSELSKYNTLISSLVLSLPLTSMILFSIIYFESKDVKQILAMSRQITFLLPLSTIFFIALYYLLKNDVSFWLSMAMSVAATAICSALAFKFI